MFRARAAEPAQAVYRERRPMRSPYGERRRYMAGAGGSTMGSGFAMGSGLLVRAVEFVVGIVVLVIVLGIVLVLFDANVSNSVVSQVEQWARSLAGPFDGIFSLHSRHAAIAVNWGIAALVYAAVGGLIARLIDGARG